MTSQSRPTLQPSSFRDPAGVLFVREGRLYRQINNRYSDDYAQLMGSGLYDDLIGAQLLIPHEEVLSDAGISADAYKVIRPEPLAFVSYPYEWSFSQLKDAALTTLAIQKKALEHGLILKDSSAYNIQFHNGKPTLIDTLSFEKYSDGQPWFGYRQFCQHFFAPLALMSCVDVRLGQLLRIHIDGVPLDLANSLLPWRKRLNFSFFTHLYLHARAQKRYAGSGGASQQRAVSRRGLLGITENLESTIDRLNWAASGTEWAGYYEDTNYSDRGLESKKTAVDSFLSEVRPRLVCDLGSNTGVFSRLASGIGALTISCDFDPAAVELNYLKAREDGETHILPLVMDLTNPSPGIGWSNEERDAFVSRGKFDTVMALALVHHLAISNNVPLQKIAEFFHSLCRHLVIEFVPKADSQVQQLLTTREDIFDSYTQAQFEAEFAAYFSIEKSAPVVDSNRVLYLMKALDAGQ